MKRFVKTKFFMLLQETSPGNVPEPKLSKAYEQFAFSIFAGNNVIGNRTPYCNALIYTRVELESLTKGLEKKRGNLC